MCPVVCVAQDTEHATTTCLGMRWFWIPELQPWNPVGDALTTTLYKTYLQNENGNLFCKTGTELAVHHLWMH